MLKILTRTLKPLFLSVSFLTLVPLGFANPELTDMVDNSGLSGSFLAAQVALKDSDDMAAVEFMKRAVSLDPENDKLKQNYFLSLLTNGQIEEAAALARDTKDLGQQKDIASLTIAADDMRKRSWKSVESTIGSLDLSDLDNTLRVVMLSWNDVGQSKSGKGLERLAALDGPEWIKALADYHSGLIASILGKDDIAAKHLQAVVDNRAVISVLTETYIRSIEALVRNRSKVGDNAKAREVLDFGLELLPNHSPFLELDKELKEEKVLGDLITTPQQGGAEIYFNIASAIQRDGASDAAKAYFQIANYLAPGDDVILIGLAELYLRQGFYEISSKFYEQVDKSSPFYKISKLEMASNLARQDKKEEAITALRQLIEENPNDLAGYMALGSLLSREKRYRDAADIFDMAVEQFNGDESHYWNLYFRRGIAYERLKEWDKAEPNFKKSLELAPNQAEVLNYLGYSWIDQGLNLDEGMDMIRKAVELRPRSGFIVDSLGWAYYRLGKYDEAVRQLERAVELMPEDPTVNDHLGDAYWQVGRKLEATFQWKIALASQTEPENPDEIKAKLEHGLVSAAENEAKN